MNLKKNSCTPARPPSDRRAHACEINFCPVRLALRWADQFFEFFMENLHTILVIPAQAGIHLILNYN